jgi:hypothetical protein
MTEYNWIATSIIAALIAVLLVRVAINRRDNDGKR